jgi:hypothetical protein
VNDSSFEVLQLSKRGGVGLKGLEDPKKRGFKRAELLPKYEKWRVKTLCATFKDFLTTNKNTRKTCPKSVL